MLHGHKQGVEDDANGDGQIHKWVHDHHADDLLDLQPRRATVPDQTGVGESIPAGGAFLSRLFKLWKSRNPMSSLFCEVILQDNGLIFTFHGVGEDTGHTHGSLPASWFF